MKLLWGEWHWNGEFNIGSGNKRLLEPILTWIYVTISYVWYGAVRTQCVDDKSTLVQVMAWCCQETSHYLSLCWFRSMSPYDVTRPHRVNLLKWIFKCTTSYLWHIFYFYWQLRPLCHCFPHETLLNNSGTYISCYCVWSNGNDITVFLTPCLLKFSENLMPAQLLQSMPNFVAITVIIWMRAKRNVHEYKLQVKFICEMSPWYVWRSFCCIVLVVHVNI